MIPALGPRGSQMKFMFGNIAAQTKKAECSSTEYQEIGWDHGNKKTEVHIANLSARNCERNV